MGTGDRVGPGVTVRSVLISSFNGSKRHFKWEQRRRRATNLWCDSSRSVYFTDIPYFPCVHEQWPFGPPDFDENLFILGLSHKAATAALEAQSYRKKSRFPLAGVAIRA